MKEGRDENQEAETRNPHEQKEPTRQRDLLLALCRNAKGGYLFTDEEGRPLNRNMVDGAFRRACKRAEITGLRFHDLRHEYGSRLGDADVNLAKIARLMGHSDTRQTMRYVHPGENELLAATEVATHKPESKSTRIVPGRVRGVR